MLYGEQYWFYDHPTALTLPPMLYKQLIEGACHSVCIWDPYFNVPGSSNKERSMDDDSKLFSYIRQPLHLRYLLDRPEIKAEMYQDWENSISKNITLNDKANLKIEFGYINKKSETHFSKFWEFHDRFLIIDKRDVYLMGASVGYHLNPTHSTGICKLEHDSDIDIVIQQFERYWSEAKKLNGIREMKI